jgi:HK97 gp10 family phage protein
MASEIRNARRLRRLLKRAEPAIRQEYKVVSREIGNAVLEKMRELVAEDKGDLKNALSARVSPDGLSVSVGLTTKRRRQKFFYSRFIEGGTKGYPERNIPPMPARPFMEPAFELTKPENIKRANNLIKTSLRKIAGDA